MYNTLSYEQNIVTSVYWSLVVLIVSFENKQTRIADYNCAVTLVPRYLAS
jgi:hypothetical protein